MRQDEEENVEKEYGGHSRGSRRKKMKLVGATWKQKENVDSS